MNQNTKILLQQIKDELKQTLDLNIGHDAFDHIANYVARKCMHPIYYQHGFYKNPNYWKGELDPTVSTKKDCDYCLVQCLECGNFKKIDKPKFVKNWVHLKGKPLIIVSSNSFEEVRQEYLETCLTRSEHQTVKIFQKKYSSKK